ncbi:MAG: 23S rRNA (adenine(2030)-N(6))-methyltransferase RlmJ [Alphaproteobacteria bacterium]|nr:23S rRNA (adenine(2030)-N(6))-methyltransferase RlmJ [Alphaproteobacteria bacterium]
MNYRHHYHAGNFADVLKHAVLALLVANLTRKPKGFAVIDTHGGAGIYDLLQGPSQKTLEWRDGIGRVLAARDGAPPALLPYFQAMQGDKGRYPGSPLLAGRLMRAQDRLYVCELHPEDAALLKAAMAGEAALLPRVQVVAGDGYRNLLRQVPPQERRGLVLIDPPFEAADEFERLAQAVIAAHRAWAQGCYLLWYPVKDGAAAAAFEAEIQTHGIADILRVRLRVRGGGEGLCETGLIIINPVYPLEDQLRAVLPWLSSVLAQGEGAGFDLLRLAAE